MQKLEKILENHKPKIEISLPKETLKIIIPSLKTISFQTYKLQRNFTAREEAVKDEWAFQVQKKSHN